jgi:hypothetical protein
MFTTNHTSEGHTGKKTEAKSLDTASGKWGMHIPIAGRECEETESKTRR